ncbi:hypothetical protein CDD81_1078 [Ophiocordyceps australis]|uniref:AMP-dependent synthetase/ligase domain-containing protein n=1 Tax=Ophiocordyceps australis TaxID=1399860 RepID=A0A2C5XZQ6_9HYPO|nr:hypothetical protein CDD81_1078 [Ophiocordyceps australis]
MSRGPFSLKEVLAVARIHPFYTKDAEYPPDAEAVEAALSLSETDQDALKLESWPLVHKTTLYTVIQRLVNDLSPQNTYRQAVFASITGGGYGSKPLFFATDILENRAQRAQFGWLIRTCGIVQKGDWVATVHTAGELYRSLDFILETLENAGACVLSAGNHMAHADVVRLLMTYHINVLTGDSSQIVQLVMTISQLAKADRDKVMLNKIIYTSEVLTRAQRTYIKEVLGPVKMYSLLASAESGAWAVSNPDITGEVTGSSADFIFDTRNMLIEILDSSATSTLPRGETGRIAQTCLSRLRNPLVRYVTGDVGSLHPFPTQSLISDAHRQHLALFRLHGRDQRFSFDWDGEYLSFADLEALVTSQEYGVLQWQVILDNMDDSPLSSLQLRVLSALGRESAASRELEARVRTFVHAVATNEHRFHMCFVDSVLGFERSATGRKVTRFINRYN